MNKGISPSPRHGFLGPVCASERFLNYFHVSWGHDTEQNTFSLPSPNGGVDRLGFADAPGLRLQHHSWVQLGRSPRSAVGWPRAAAGTETFNRSAADFTSVPQMSAAVIGENSRPPTSCSAPADTRQHIKIRWPKLALTRLMQAQTQPLQLHLPPNSVLEPVSVHTLAQKQIKCPAPASSHPV